MTRRDWLGCLYRLRLAAVLPCTTVYENSTFVSHGGEFVRFSASFYVTKSGYFKTRAKNTDSAFD